MSRLLEITDSNGDYPLHLCVLENLLDMMVTLLREGADPLMVNTRGETPLVVAMDIQAEPEMTQILEQAEQEAEAQRVELQATELEAEAEAVLEHGDTKTARQKLLAAAELYRQISAQEEAEACQQKAKALPHSASSTPKSTKSPKLGVLAAAADRADEPAPVPSTSFSKLKKRLLGSEPAAGTAASRPPPAYLSALPGAHEDDDDDDALSAASDKQVLHAVEKLAKKDEDSAKARQVFLPVLACSLSLARSLSLPTSSLFLSLSLSLSLSRALSHTRTYSLARWLALILVLYVPRVVALCTSLSLSLSHSHLYHTSRWGQRAGHSFAGRCPTQEKTWTHMAGQARASRTRACVHMLSQCPNYMYTLSLSLSHEPVHMLS